MHGCRRRGYSKSSSALKCRRAKNPFELFSCYVTSIVQLRVTYFWSIPQCTRAHLGNKSPDCSALARRRCKQEGGGFKQNKYWEGWNARSRTYLTESTPWVARFIIPLWIITHQLQTWYKEQRHNSSGVCENFMFFIRGLILMTLTKTHIQWLGRDFCQMGHFPVFFNVNDIEIFNGPFLIILHRLLWAIFQVNGTMAHGPLPSQSLHIRSNNRQRPGIGSDLRICSLHKKGNICNFSIHRLQCVYF